MISDIDDRSQLRRRRSVEKLLSQVQLVIGSVQQTLNEAKYIWKAFFIALLKRCTKGIGTLFKRALCPFALPKLYFLVQKVFVHQVLLIQRYKSFKSLSPSTAIVVAVLDRDENRESSS